MPTFNEFTFLSNDKVHNIFFRECVPDGNIRGVVQIVHGIAEHSKRYEHFMSFLAENGFVAVADDHLGHGYSIGSDPTDQGWFAENDGWMTVVRDLNNLRLIEQDGQPSYFIVVDFIGDTEKTFADIADVAKPFLDDEIQLSMMPFSMEFARNAVKGIEPFYIKKEED